MNMKTDSKTIFFTDTIGGHIALDLLNTVSIVNGEVVDSLQSEEDVMKWLSQNAVTGDNSVLKRHFPDLVSTTRELRETLRHLFSSRKEGKQLDVRVLNAYLQYGASYLQLVSVGEEQYDLERVRKVETVAQLLAPIAEAAAELLAMEDFSRVRKCESADCVLWFYDSTKSHKRRWCSMAVCGNRHKVSSFRKRQNA
ncbi:MAG TPA: ABATE domain-containing protein [Methylophilaceae bacterium]|nr:ABATE domain-containing protein [Methylophilaceae bacterium]